MVLCVLYDAMYAFLKRLKLYITQRIWKQAVWGIAPKALHMVGKQFTTELATWHCILIPNVF